MSHKKDRCPFCGEMKDARAERCNLCYGRFVGLSIEERFWRYVAKGQDNECWLWQGMIGSNNNYGLLNVDGEMKPAHRLSYEIAFGDIPDGLEVCHHCDNPICVNPHHLFLGTHKENMQDAARKGRLARGERLWMAKLKRGQVREIRRAYQRGESMRALGRRYGVHHGTISAIVNGHTWRHVA